MLYKNLFQLYLDNFQNNCFLLFDKLEDIRYIHFVHVCMLDILLVKSSALLGCTQVT